MKKRLLTICVLFLTFGLFGCAPKKDITNETKKEETTTESKQIDKTPTDEATIEKQLKDAGFTFRANSKSIPTTLIMSDSNTDFAFSIIEWEVRMITMTSGAGAISGVVYNTEGEGKIDADKKEEFDAFLKEQGISEEDFIKAIAHIYKQSQP